MFTVEDSADHGLCAVPIIPSQEVVCPLCRKQGREVRGSDMHVQWHIQCSYYNVCSVTELELFTQSFQDLISEKKNQDGCWYVDA